MQVPTPGSREGRGEIFSRDILFNRMSEIDGSHPVRVSICLEAISSSVTRCTNLPGYILPK
jgi:hypothetical protein